MTTESYANAWRCVKWAQRHGSRSRTLQGAIAYLTERAGHDPEAEEILGLVSLDGIKGKLRAEDYRSKLPIAAFLRPDGPKTPGDRA